MDNEKGSVDLLGIKPVADSINKVTEGSVNGASAFLSRICLPAAEEFGLLLRDKVSSWRAKNAVEIVNKSQALLEEQMGNVILHAHPRIVYSTIENGSWADNDLMQNLWAGLLASSCTSDGKDESNLILINLLSNLTTSQAKLIEYIASNCTTFMSEAGWIGALPFHLELDDLVEIMNITDVYQIDRELDHLRAQEIITRGFSNSHTKADVTPTALCLNLFCRGQGFVGNPCEYFNSKQMSTQEIDQHFWQDNLNS